MNAPRHVSLNPQPAPGVVADPSGQADMPHSDAEGNNLALAAVLLSIPVGVAAVPVLLFTGYSLAETLLLALIAQVASFWVGLAWGTMRHRASGRPGKTALASAVNDLPPTPQHHIWRSHAARVAAARPLTIACAAPDSVQGRTCATDLAGLGHEVHHATDLDVMLDTVATRPADWDMLIVDLDLRGDIEDIVDDLLDFRARCPDVSVLLLSGSVGRDDLSPERRAIGDATLRKPVFRKRLAEGVGAARQNAAERSGGTAAAGRAQSMRR